MRILHHCNFSVTTDSLVRDGAEDTPTLLMDVEEGAFILDIELEDEVIFMNDGKLLSSS